MTTASLALSRASDWSRRFSVAPLWWWVAASVAVIAVRAIATLSTSFADNIIDTDDATRLVQVREFMAGAPWFDTTTYKFGGDSGMLSHWSRFIDLPLALMIGLLTPFAGSENAEIVVCTVWPLIVLAPMLWLTARAVDRVAGRTAAALSLALAILAPMALYQFAIGRIDHHEVMIVCTIGAAFLIWSYWGEAKVWAIAGAMSGFGLAIGYEALFPVALVVVAAVIAALYDRELSRAASALLLSIAAVFTVCFFLTIPPSHWLDVHCDAISLNMVAMALCGAAGVWLAMGRMQDQQAWQRLTVIAVSGGIGLTIFGASNPACLAGPFGGLPKSLWPIWLDFVAENASIVSDIFAGRLEQSLALIVFFGFGIAAQLANWKKSGAERDLYLLCTLIAVAAIACYQFKYIAYASWLAIPPLAIWVTRIEGSAEVSARTSRLAGLMLVNQSTLLLVTAMLAAAVSADAKATDANNKAASSCLRPTAVRALDVLPSGLALTHIDLGPFVAVMTKHRVLTAPYHRIPKAILSADAMFKAKSFEEAHKLLEAGHIDYVITCTGLDAPLAKTKGWEGSLRARLMAGETPDFLERVPVLEQQAYQVWRVKAGHSNPRL